MSTNYISTLFNQRHPLIVTKTQAEAIQRQCAIFEVKKNHAEVLNTNLLGVQLMYFLPEDYNALFTIFGVSRDEFTETKNMIPTSVIDKKWNVVGDPYNLLTLWIAHKVITSKSLSKDMIQKTILALFKLLLYKFFTSLISTNYFKYGANEGIMQATMDSLSNKFDIVIYGTWKEDLEHRAEDIFRDAGRDPVTNKSVPASRHRETLIKFNDDSSIIRILSDTQTRIRNKVKVLAGRYHEMRALGDKVKTYNIVSEVDGERIIKHMNNSFTSVIENTFTQILNKNAFIDNVGILLMSELSSNVKTEQFRRLLIKFSDLASSQVENSEADTIFIDRKDKLEYLTGTHILIQELIQKSYRYCILKKVPMKSKLSILIKVGDIYTSSRLKDEDILKVKRSVARFVTSTGLTIKEDTISSLTIGFIRYIILRSFAYVN